MIKAGEISEIIRRQIQEFEGETDLAEIGRVIEVGDGIARVYGLERRDGRRAARVPAATSSAWC